MPKKKTQNKISKQEMLDALTLVKPGLANKEIVEQSTHFILDDDKIWTYNDTITVMHKFHTGITGAVNADTLFKLISNMPDTEISISEKDNKLQISTDKIKSTVKIDPEIKLQPLKVPGANSKEWKTLPENFCEAIKFSAFSASQNMIRPELTCLWITEGCVLACDSFRGTKYELSEDMQDLTPEESFLLPAKAAIALLDYNPIKIMIDYEHHWLHFINNQKTTFSCRTYSDADYPRVAWKLFDDIEGEKIELPEDFLEGISRAQVFLTDDFELDKFISIDIAGGVLRCKGEGNYGDIEQEYKVDYDGEISIKVHPVLLSEIVKHIRTVTIGERLLFKGDSFEHAVCLSDE